MQPRMLSRWALTATIALVTLGAFTRGSGSGYGCEDRWPLCEDGLLGGLLPRAEFDMIVEWSHRWLAAVVGVLAIVTAVAAWRTARRWVAWVAIAAIGVIGVQAWVGRLIVTRNLDADLVSLHLAISLTVAGLLTLVVVGTTRVGAASPDRRWAVWFGGGAALAAVVLVLGSLVHDVYVPGWPLTLDQIVPDLGSRTIAIHFLHRVSAAAGLVASGWLFARARAVRRPPAEVALALTGFAAFVVNVALGAAHVFTRVSSSALVAAHVAVASIAVVALIAAAATAAGAAIRR